jgi:tryptophanyl-tRNA synthetase
MTTHHKSAPLRSLSGIKPTGQPHWGNYFGMIKPALQLAEGHDAFYFIADLHALTTVRDPESLRRDSLGIAATMLACGMDPDKAVLWRQSDVPEVLERAHSYKDARAKGRDITHGVVTYPVLMAADILLYDSDVVPVGKDQMQHLEMARDMATYFNVAFLGQQPGADEAVWDGRMLKRPAAVVQEATVIVPGLDGQKMSKSYGNYIAVFAPAKELKQRIMAIKTDSKPLEAPKDPDGDNVFALYKLFATPAQQHELAEKYRAGNFGYGHAKLALLELAEAHFAPQRQRYEELMADPAELERILHKGALRARHVAEGVIARVREATGLPRKPAGR